MHLRCAGIRQEQYTYIWTCHLYTESELTTHTCITPPQPSRPWSSPLPTPHLGSKRHSLQAVELSQRTQAAVQIVSNLPAPSDGGPIYRFWSCRPCGPAGCLVLLLTKAGDVETNPGPTTLNKKVWICDICHKQIPGYKTGARYSQNASVKGSGRVPKSVHSPVISSTKKRSDIGVACTTIYL